MTAKGRKEQAKDGDVADAVSRRARRIMNFAAASREKQSVACCALERSLSGRSPPRSNRQKYQPNMAIVKVTGEVVALAT